MTAEVDIQGLADALFEAERTREPIEPLSATAPSLTPEQAYEIQLVNVARRLEAGARLCGHKIGLTAKVMQELMGIDEPDYGHLFDDMFVSESSTASLDRYIAPLIEVETAFILGRPLHGPGATIADVIRAVEWVVPCFEIIDSRIRDWRIGHTDTIADNGSSAAVILGGCPARLDAVDLRNMGVTLSLDGKPASLGSTADVLGNPLTAVAWLANALARHGIAMNEGHVVLPGSCVRAIPLARGVTATATFGQLGDVTVSFA